MPNRPLYACRLPLLIRVALLLGGAGLPLQAQPSEPAPCAACAIIVLTPGESLLAADPLGGLELLVRTSPPEAPRSAVPEGGYEAEHVRSAIEALGAAGGRPGLLLARDDVARLDPELVRGVARIVLQLGEAGEPGPEVAFELKTRLSELRGAASGAALGISAEAALVDALLARDIGPYVDFVVRQGVGPPPAALFPGSSPVLGVLSTVDGARGGPEGDERWLVALPADAPEAQRLLRDLARAAPLLRDGLIAGGTAEVRCGSRRAATYLDPASLDTIAIARGCGDLPIVVVPDVRGIERVRLSGGDVIVRVPAAEEPYTEDVRVIGARTLTVREIIARHQAAAARQRRAVRQLISTGSMTLTFEAPGFPAPMAITSETIVFTSPDRVEIEQRDIRVNGVAFRADGIPRLPLLEPERVATPPLAIALTDVYAYSLAGQETIGGTRCHVIAFEPLERGRSLFAGRAWIARDSFAMVRVSAVQTALRGPIVSSEQTDEFRPVGDAWLLARSDVRQIYEGAGHRTPIHRVLAISGHEVNPPAFEARRLAAYASPSVMLRDTPDGFRYLQRERGTPENPQPAPAVTGPATRVRTFAAGVIIDPNISRPLPFAGLSYVDFDLFGTGAQVNAFFGGTYGQLAVSVPSLGGSRWQLGGRAFGIASSYNDRAFLDGRERYEQNISQRPAHASWWLVRPLTPRLSLRAGYEFDYIHFGRAGSTSPSFVIPAAQASHGLRLAADGQWTGWAASVWWLGARRGGWRPWGEEQAGSPPEQAGTYAPRHADYQRFGGSVGRSWVTSPRLVGRVDAGWMGGRDLDRFSRYTFGSFDNRLRGYPAALIRYDSGTVLRASAAWAVASRLRLDGFVDTAFVRDPGFGGIRDFTGLGAAAELPVPFGTLLAVEWGYGFQGVNTDGSRGTHVIRISGYKMF